MKYRLLTTTILLLLFVACKTKKNGAKSFLENVDSLLVRNTHVSINNLEIPYRLFTPNNIKNEKKPLVIFLHGRGERGTENGQRIYKNAGILMNENSLLTNKLQHKYPCYVLAHIRWPRHIRRSILTVKA